MILVDTSVWVDHLRASDAALVQLLESSQVVMHPFVLGELACGKPRNRKELLELLKNLPCITVAADDEVLFFIEQHKLMGLGIGLVDVHLLAAVILQGNTRLWTRDKRLHSVAAKMGIAYPPGH